MSAFAGAVEMMTWQPYYRFDEGYSAYQLNQKHISRLGLQYWSVDTTGKLYNLTVDSNITRFKTIADQNKAKTLLCVFNYNLQNSAMGWDWAVAKKAFVDRRDAFVGELIAEVDRYQLHGVDLDIEGMGAATKDTAGKIAYLQFARQLADSLHARGAILTADTYASTWGGPSQSWWPQMDSIFDGIQEMGYSETSACPSTASFKCYAGQVATAKRAGLERTQLYLGIAPETNAAKWGSTNLEYSLMDNLREVQRLVQPVAFWDLPGLGRSEWAADSVQAKLDEMYALKDSGQEVQVPVLAGTGIELRLHEREIEIKGAEGASMELLDVHGKTLIRSEGRSVLSWAHLPAASYFFRLNYQGQTYSTAIVKKI